jgi:riboflavin synthase
MEGMFTGIVEEIGAVQGTTSNSLAIKAKLVLEGTKLGDSISVNGACLTVTKLSNTGFAVEIMPETKRLTNIGLLKIGDKLNLERALPTGARIGGHFVQGHVDSMGKLVSLAADGEATVASVSAPAEIMRYVVKKGFIAVNGVSLTVVDHDELQFSVSLVTYTKENTNLGLLRRGSIVNLEVDIMAKYIEKFYHPDKQEGIITLLSKYDYLKAR